MITIKDIRGNVLAEGGDDGATVSGEINTKITNVIYVDYNKGDEDGLNLTFDSYNKSLDSYYPIMYEDSAETVTPIKKVLSNSGKYRLLMTIAECENRLKVNVTFNNITGTPGTATVTIVPMSPTI